MEVPFVGEAARSPRNLAKGAYSSLTSSGFIPTAHAGFVGSITTTRSANSGCFSARYRRTEDNVTVEIEGGEPAPRIYIVLNEGAK